MFQNISKYLKESLWASFLIPLWMYNGWKDERMKGESSWMNSIDDYANDDARDDVNNDVGDDVGDVTHDMYLYITMFTKSLYKVD